MESQIKNLMQNKIAIIIQARMNSTRLPSKVLAKLNEKSLFEFLVTRLKKSSLVNEIIWPQQIIPWMIHCVKKVKN